LRNCESLNSEWGGGAMKRGGHKTILVEK
jgi:hypothetical protein